MIRIFLIISPIIFSMVTCTNDRKKEALQTTGKQDDLPSWNDGPLKQSIIDYVRTISDTTSGKFIPVRDRIATFDNDGTLWAERPYVQELFALHQVKKMLTANPSLATRQPFKAVAENDKAYFSTGGEKAMLELINATHTGMTEDEFDTAVREFYSTVRYPHGNVPIQQIVYQPQLELLNFLRKHDFKVFICTGGTVDFVRGISEDLYEVPRYQVIGTTFKYRFNDSSLNIMRMPGFTLLNDKEGKPVGIQQHIGQRPVFACGNEGGEGDIAMLTYSQGSRYPSYQLLINHDDSVREFYYQEKSNASLTAAARRNWHVVSMKNDWRTVFVNKK